MYFIIHLSIQKGGRIMDAFKTFLVSNNLAPNTVSAYITAVKGYISDYDDFTKKNLLAWKAYLIENFKAKTVNLKLQAINKYLEFIKKPNLRIKSVKVQQRTFLENVISDADYVFFKKKLKQESNKEWYFIVRFLCATGARVSELIKIKVEHVNLGYIDLYTKGGKIRRIYRMFIEGKSQSTIASTLTKEGVPTPSGKTKWQYNVVDSILRNEKYKGSALLQKKYTVDFLTKKLKKNNGEVAQYYVEDSHPAIINPDEWELVQAELELNNQVRSHGNNVLCGRVICADCGSIYGPKVWHSNDIYRHVVWQCNNKFNGTKCTTPTLDEETIKSAYLKALNILLKDKDLLISNLLLIKEKLLDVNLSKPMEQAKNEMLVVSGLCDQHIFNKEKKQMKYEAYMEEYIDLVKRFTKAQDEYNKLIAEQVDRNRQSIKLQAFINEIKATNTLNLEFNDKLFNLTIINIKVYKDSHLEFNFKDGSVINIEL